MKARILLAVFLLSALAGAQTNQENERVRILLDHQRDLRKSITLDEANLAKISKGYTLLHDTNGAQRWVSPDELDTLETLGTSDFPGIKDQVANWNRLKAKFTKYFKNELHNFKADLQSVDAELNKREAHHPKTHDLTLRKVEEKDATEGDPKAWHYPKSAGAEFQASFDYPGLPTPTFTVKAPQSISPSSGGVLHLEVDLNGSGRASGDAHINLWVNGLKFQGANVLEIKVDAGKSGSISQDYTLTLANPASKEVSFTVGLTWGGPKYTFTYRQ